LKKANILLLDETFAAVGAENIEDTSSLLSEMAKKLGLDILLVTHNPGVNQWANQVFQVKLKNHNLEIEKTK
jgi:ABC-type lipoprotein export system ATPase subunit